MSTAVGGLRPQAVRVRLSFRSSAVVGVCLLALALRLPTAGAQSFWFDESFTVRIVDGSFWHLLGRLSATESTPPAYYVLASAWRTVFGDGELGLRSLSVLLGVASVPLAAAIATHYFALFLVLAQAGVLLRATGRHALGACLIPAATGLTLLPLLLDQRVTSAGMATGGQALTTRLGAVPKKWLVGEQAASFDVWLVVAVLALLVAAGLVLALRPGWLRRPPVRALWFLIVVGAGLPFVLAVVGADYLDARNLLAVWPLALVLVATGLVSTRVGAYGTAAALVLVGGSTAVCIAIAMTPSLQRDDWRGAAAAIAASNPDVLILDGSASVQPLSLYRHVIALPFAGMRARSVSVLSLRRPLPAVVARAPQTFRLSGSRMTASWRLDTYTTPTPVLIGPLSVAGAWQSAGGRGASPRTFTLRHSR